MYLLRKDTGTKDAFCLVSVLQLKLYFVRTCVGIEDIFGQVRVLVLKMIFFKYGSWHCRYICISTDAGTEDAYLD